ncbi:hypothetical protein [Paraflavitalea sp. CAU 1676]|uniref:hypothetical protein n=1 Tax=Paraflavitalea sp. CAU 1676 TaxID=3032598 RepID=UPI0023DAE41A|nr:hypothetical protein [Paraflavitalea sp. CAU 1676]MDF2188509.1 hypothetical protein [Paraflavitalea sp. CAU 1676]
MKLLILVFCLGSICSTASAQTRTFVGSTPAHAVVRTFLGISATDSIDFIRWKLIMHKAEYEISCQYGLSKPNTPGFSNEQRVQWKGKVTEKDHVYSLTRANTVLHLMAVNDNLLHLLDQSRQMLVGNGGYSFVLNNTSPSSSKVFALTARPNRQPYPLVFEGRTPCQELSAFLGLNKSDACFKLKWYILLFVDSLTGKPSYYLKGGIAYRQETMDKGSWQVKTEPNGRIIYELTPNKGSYTLRLLKGDDNILFFIRPDGSLLVGNEDFSYTLNRREKQYPRQAP